MWTLQSELIKLYKGKYTRGSEGKRKKGGKSRGKITAHKNSLSEEAITPYYGANHCEMRGQRVGQKN